MEVRFLKLTVSNHWMEGAVQYPSAACVIFSHTTSVLAVGRPKSQVDMAK